MCGVIGYIGKNDHLNKLLDGLKKLEYRGYDSAGIVLKTQDGLQIVKSVGKIVNLEEKIKKEHIGFPTMGLAHTRWATHGIPNETNAHPHRIGKVTLVHNGIIENFKELKEKLENEGIDFKSDTDTEVIVALINKYLENDPIAAINKTISEIKGSYALGIIVDGFDKLYAVKKESPLIVGIAEDGCFIASDVTAIINYTNQCILLEDNEIAELSNDSVRIIKDDKEIKKKIITADILKEETSKNGYDHYMLKEIMEEPIVIQRLMNLYLDDLSKLPDLSQYEEIHIVACGSAMYAGMVGKALLEEYANTKVQIDVASEYRYKNIIYNKKTLVILISQSGETADTIAAMRKAKSNNIDTLAIVNVKTSTIARESDKQLFIEAGPEIAVATTKAYLLQVVVLSLISFKVALKKKLITNEKEILEEYRNLPKMLTEILNKKEQYRLIANEIYQSKHVFFIGRKIDYAICLEGSLKLKEISYIHAEAYQAGELKHGTISLIEKGVPVFAIITDESIFGKTTSNVAEVKSRGAHPYIITTARFSESEEDVLIPSTNRFIQAILAIPPLQLIAYETAKLRQCDIDMPKNLAKSVTVE